jgi:hypothetical protein
MFGWRVSALYMYARASWADALESCPNQYPGNILIGHNNLADSPTGLWFASQAFVKADKWLRERTGAGHPCFSDLTVSKALES